MPQEFQVVEVPGYGEVEFPATMSDAEIAAAIRRNLAPPPPAPRQKRTIGDYAADVAIGAGKGVLSDINTVSRLLNKIPYVGEYLAPSEGVRAAEQLATPENTAQKVGYYVEQIGEFMLPGAAVSKLGKAQVAGQVTKAALARAAAKRAALEAAGSAAVESLHGGDPLTGAVAGAAGSGVAQGLRAARVAAAASPLARKIAQGAIPAAGGISAYDVYRNPEEGAKRAALFMALTGLSSRHGEALARLLRSSLLEMARNKPQERKPSAREANGIVRDALEASRTNSPASWGDEPATVRDEIRKRRRGAEED